MASLKGIKKGDMVTLHMFTGAIVSGFKVEKADATTLSFTNKKGVVMTFDKKTGKQIDPEPKSEKFANFVTEYDEEGIAAAAEKRSVKKPKAEKPVKTKEPEPEEVEEEDDDNDFEDDFDDDEEEEPEPEPVVVKKKKAIVKKAKMIKKQAEEDDEDDGFEELD